MATQQKKRKRPVKPGVLPTCAELRARFHYDPDTGLFLKNGRPHGKTRRNDGYVIINYTRHVRVRAHRAAWCYVHGEWPQGVIDHINGKPADNRIKNLRVVTQAQNMQNQLRPRSATGFFGVSRRGSRFRARLMFKGKTISFGTFDTAEEAGAVALEAKRRLHPFFAG